MMTWGCVWCGHYSLSHHEHCDKCGEPRPAPLPEPKRGELSKPLKDVL